MPAKKSKKGSNEQATSILYHTLTYLLAQNWVLVDFVANDFCWLPLRLHKL